MTKENNSLGEFHRKQDGTFLSGHRSLSPRSFESWEFSPRAVFMAMQSKSTSSYSCLTAGEIYTWLTQQSFRMSVFTADDVGEVILPVAEVYSELRYDGFLRMVLGMLIMGFLCSNLPTVCEYVGQRTSIGNWSPEIRLLALTMILCRAGLGLDVEASMVVVIPRIFLGFDWLWVFMLAHVVMPISLAVVSLFRERSLMDNAFAFANKNAICTENSYICTGTKGTYSSLCCTVGLALGSVTGFKDVTVNSVEAHMDALVREPVSVAIGADSVLFQLYSGGVMTFWCGTNLDRGVLAAGYGTDGSSDYLKVKNSWGLSWSESGFFRMVKGKGGAGEYGILSGPPPYPVVSSSFAGLDGT